MRRATTVLISAAIWVAALTLGATSARATVEFDGSQAAGATFGAGLLTGIACWTLELAMGEEEERYGEVTDDYDRRGWYVGIEGVYAYEDLKEGDEEDDIQKDSLPFDISFDLDDDHAGGLNFKVGRRCHSRLAVEVEVEWIDEYEGTVTEPTVGDAAKITFSPIVVATINVKGFLLTGRFQPYVVVGVGTMALETETSDITNSVVEDEGQMTGMLALRFGGGIDIYATRNWIVTGGIDYVYSTTNIDNMNYLSVGLGVQYRF